MATNLKYNSISFTENNNLAQLTILLAEDYREISRLTKNVLEKHGAKVVTAFNGKEAVDLALSNEFDVVLMDLHMPVLDGFDAAKILRYLKYHKTIIALSSYGSDYDLKKCNESGFDKHVAKQAGLQQLVSLLETYTNH